MVMLLALILLMLMLQVLLATNSHGGAISFNVRGQFGSNGGRKYSHSFATGHLRGFSSMKCGDGARPTVHHLTIIDGTLSPNAGHAVASAMNADVETVSGIGPGSVVFYMMWASAGAVCQSEA